jgi:hypothetical protein
MAPVERRMTRVERWVTRVERRLGALERRMGAPARNIIGPTRWMVGLARPSVGLDRRLGPLELRARAMVRAPGRTMRRPGPPERRTSGALRRPASERDPDGQALVEGLRCRRMNIVQRPTVAGPDHHAATTGRATALRRVLFFGSMAPRVRPDLPTVRPSPEDEAEIRTAVAELDRGEGRALTEEELRHLAETGEWPEWCDSSG